MMRILKVDEKRVIPSLVFGQILGMITVIRG